MVTHIGSFHSAQVKFEAMVTARLEVTDCKPSDGKNWEKLYPSGRGTP